MARRGAKLGTSVLDLDVDDSRYHSKLSGARIAAEKWTDQTGAAITRAGKAISGVGQAWTRNVTVPILAAGAATGKLALDFDTSLRQISGLTDVTGDELDGIREKVLALGPAVGKGPQELVDAFYFIASAGFKADEAMEVLETSARAAAAGLGETKTIAQVLGGVINAYGRENITSARAADILTEAVSQGTAEASGLASVIGNVVPGAAALGVSFDQVTAALAGMTLTGVGVEESATSLIQIFNSLLKPTAQAEEAMEGLGLSSEELRRQLREQGLLATLRTLEERFAGNETAAAAVFGNIRALRGVTALLTLDSEQLNQVFGKVADSAGRLATAYEETEGPQRDLDRAMADIQATAIQLGQDVLPIAVEVMKQLAAGAREVGEWWRSLDDGTKKLVVQVLALLAVAGPLLLVVGKLTTGLGLLFKGVSVLSSAKGIAGLTRLLGRAGLLAVLVVVTAAVGKLHEAVQDFFFELTHGKKALKDFKALADLLGDPGKAIVLENWGISAKRFGEIMEQTGQDAETVFNAIKDAGGDVAVAIGEIRAAAGELVDDRSFEEWDRRAQRAMHGVQESATTTAAEVPPAIAALLGEGAAAVAGGMEEGVVDPIEEALQKAKEEAGRRAAEVLTALTTGLVGNPEELEQQITDFIEQVTHPYVDLKRRADIEAVLASKAVRDGLRSQDSKIRADTVAFVEDKIEQYELLAPGALAAGQLVNPKLRAGINRNLDALLHYVETDIVKDGVGAGLNFEDVAREAGLDGIAAYSGGIKAAEAQATRSAIDVRQAAARELAATTEPSFRSGYQRGADWASGVASPRNVTNASLAGQLLRASVKDKLYWDSYAGGRSIGDAWGRGLSASMTTVARNLGFRMGEIRALMGGSLPTAGPLQHPETGGLSIGQAWVGAITDAISGGLRAVESQVGSVDDAMRMLPSDVAVPYTPALAGLEALGGATGAMPAISAGGDVTIEYHMHYNGVERTFDSRDAFMDELEGIARFNDGAIN